MMNQELRNKYVIAGVGTSERSRQTERTVMDLAVSASRNAIHDAGVDPQQIDVVLSYQESDSCSPESLASQLGLQSVHALELLSGGASTESLVATAIGLLETSDGRAVLIYRSMLGRSGKRMGGGSGWTMDDWAQILTSGPYLVPHGIFNAGQRVALLANRFLHETGLPADALGEVCCAFYRNAQSNPTSVMFGRPLTMDGYRGTRLIAEPMRLHDYCVETDEANAIVVMKTTDAPARSGAHAGIRAVIPKVATAPSYQFVAPDPLRIAGYECARRIYELAAIQPADVQVVSVYDCFSWVALAQLIAYRLLDPDSAGDKVAAGHLDIGGDLPCNTAGGMLAEGYTHGLNNVIELVRQVRRDHEGTPRQTERSELALATGWAGPSVGSAMVLEAV